MQKRFIFRKQRQKGTEVRLLRRMELKTRGLDDEIMKIVEEEFIKK